MDLLILLCSIVCVCSAVSDSWTVPRLLCPWNFPGKNTGAGCHFILQGIFPIQRLNIWLLHFLHWQADSLPLITWETSYPLSGYLSHLLGLELLAQWRAGSEFDSHVSTLRVVRFNISVEHRGIWLIKKYLFNLVNPVRYKGFSNDVPPRFWVVPQENLCAEGVRLLTQVGCRLWGRTESDTTEAT